MTPLAPAYRSVLRVHALLWALLLLVPSGIALLLLIDDHRALAIGIGIAGALLALFIAVAIPSRRYRAWAFAALDDELHVQRGIWFQSVTIVPYGRVQHIDLSQGPLERRHKVGRLTLHTAGTLSSSVVLPGLDIADAERMRDEIRGKIRQDLA